MQQCCLYHKMSDNTADCDCCLSITSKKYIVQCNGVVQHNFCFECVSSYMIFGMKEGEVHLSCISKRVCLGYLIPQHMIRLMECARDKFMKAQESDLDDTKDKDSNIGTIVECSKCTRRIRKLAFYNYVACECGTVVCYECGENITYNVRKHPCSVRNHKREPRWYTEKPETVGYSTSRRYRTHSSVAHNQNINTDSLEYINSVIREFTFPR